MTRLLTLALLVLLACGAPAPRAQLSSHGITLRRVEQGEPSSEPNGLLLEPGDYVLSGRGLRVMVGGLQRLGQQRGAVLELRPQHTHEAQVGPLVVPVLYEGEHAHAVEVQAMFPLERHGQPALRIEGVVRLGRQRVVQVAHELSLARSPGALSISTRVASEHESTGLRLGAHVQWAGAAPFVAGLGTLADDAEHDADWLSAEGRHGSTGIAFAHGGLRVRALHELHAGQRLPLHSEVREAQPFTLAEDTPRYQKLGVFVAAHGTGSLVRTLGMWRGQPFPELWSYLPYRPPGARAALRDEQGRTLLDGTPDERGRVVLPLTATTGRFEVLASAYGHASSDLHVVQPGHGPIALQIPRGGQIRVRAQDAASDRPLAVRARFVPASGALQLGPDSRAAGAGDTVIAMTGSASVPVPPGQYRVLVSHGLEWSLAEADVTVSETFSPLVHARLSRQVEPGPYVGCDLHVHASPSPDSQVSLPDRLASLAAEGVEFAVPTDHNHVTDYAPVAAELSLHDFSTLPGVEVTTWDPAFGHFNAYPYTRDGHAHAGGAPNYQHTTPGQLFDALHAHDPDLVVQVNHPRLEGGIGYFDVMHLDPRTGRADRRYSPRFDALEVFNGFDLARPERIDEVFGDWLALLARGQRVVATGSSDSHQIRYQLAGYPRTYAQVAEGSRRDPRAIVRAIKRGHSFVSSGPFLEVAIGEAGPGEQVSALAGQVTLSVRVQAAHWLPVDRLAVYVGGQRVHEAPIAPGQLPERHLASIPLATPRDTFVVVRVWSSVLLEHFFGRAGVLPLAFSNPIYVDADGDGRTPWSPPN